MDASSFHDLNDLKVPLDAPPAYDNALRGIPPLEEKRRASTISRRHASTSSSSSASSSKSRWPWNIFGPQSSSSRALAEAQAEKTVSEMVHNLVGEVTSESDASRLTLLDICVDMAAHHGIDMAAVLQKPDADGHTPLYWAIVTRRHDDDDLSVATGASTSDDPLLLPGFFARLVELIGTLEAATIADVRLGCLQTCDQWLFQRLQLCAAFHSEAVVRKNTLLLGTSVPRDLISIGTPPRHDAPFEIPFEIVQFYKRMRVLQDVRVEFLAHGRMWQIKFGIRAGGVHAGKFTMLLTLRDNSAPTNVVGSFTIDPMEKSDSSSPSGYHSHCQYKPIIWAFDSEFSGTKGSFAVFPDVFTHGPGLDNPYLTADGALRGQLTMQLKAVH